MFGPTSSNEYTPENCIANCPRIWPRAVAGDQVEELSDASGAPINPEYATEIGRILLPVRFKPSYLFFRIQRGQCRALRNYFIFNTSILDVIGAQYIGISTKVFNINNNAVELGESIGLLRFETTDDAFRFVNQEPKMSRQEFLGGKFDIWNLTMCSPDKAVIPNPTNPEKYINSYNVFHMLNIRKLAIIPENIHEFPSEKQDEFRKEAAEVERKIDKLLENLESYNGRLVVNSKNTARIRGLPANNKAGEPGIHIYVTQWKGVQYFWQWFESEEGKDLGALLREYTSGDYVSIIYTACLDFHDLL